MKDQRCDQDVAVALFRYRLIAELLHTPPERGKLTRRLAEISSAVHDIPHSSRTHVAVETLRDWIKLHKRGGFEALKPKPRKDAGQSHALPAEVVEILCATKEKYPQYSIQLIIKDVRAVGRVPEQLSLPYSTVHRLFSKAGLMQRKQGVGGKDHRRFAFENANDLWMSDVMHGPAVTVENRTKRKTYMITIFDDCTRLVCFFLFALSENCTFFLPVLKQAVMRRGVPKRLYVDNGSAYRAHHLQLVCAKLGITLIHARAYHPEAKGKIERFHRTVRAQLLARLQPRDTSSLDALNRALWGYIEAEYHQTPHRGLGAGQSPLDAWQLHSTHIKHFGERLEIDEMFLFEQKRRVRKDRTVSLDGMHYEVEATLVGTTVVLRYDPQEQKRRVQIWHNAQRKADAKPVDVHANCFTKRDTPTAIKSPSLSGLQKHTIEKHTKEII